MNRTRTILRWLIGIFFLYTGVSKALDAGNFVAAVGAYGLLPAAAVPFAAWSVIAGEIAAGSMLFIPRWTSVAAQGLTVMLCVFTAALFVKYLGGDASGCGCGPGLEAEPRSVWPFVRNAALIIFLFPIAWPRQDRLANDAGPDTAL